MNRHYSYFIIKPDGIRYLDEICDILESKYPSVHYFAINDYENISKKLYHKHYESKGEKFAKSFDSYMYGIKELFGNYGILVLVADEKEYSELTKSVFGTKIEIRNQFINNRVGIVTNYGNSGKNYLRLVYENGKVKPPRMMQELGNHRISNMNIIHSPDPSVETTLDELRILSEEGIIDDKNMIMEDMILKMRRYHTANFQEDMRLETYLGPIQPDISGFYREEIRKESEEGEKRGESR